MPQKDSEKDPIWITESSLTSKLHKSVIETSSQASYITLEGSVGSGKTFWIEQLKRSLGSKRPSLHFSSFYEKTEEDLKKILKDWQSKKYKSDQKIWFLEWNEQDIKFLNQSATGKELYKEFNLIRFKIPSLDQRKTEIPFFVQEFSKAICKKWKRKPPSWEPAVLERIQNRVFSNNLHGLFDFVSACLSFQTGSKIKILKIPNTVWSSDDGGLNIVPGYTMLQYEKDIILANLKYMNGNREKTAQLLGISVRNLYRKIEEYQLDVGSLKI